MANNKRAGQTSFVNPPSLPGPGFYSYAVSIDGAGRHILTSGHVGQTPDGSWPTTFRDQVIQAIDNLSSSLQEAGASIRHVVQLRFYCVGWELRQGADLVGPVISFMTEKYGVQHRPLTTLVPVPSLAFPQALFEIEAVAAVSGLARPWKASTDTSLRLLRPPPPPGSIQTDVVVVGGGLAGLVAARECQAAGLRTVVLEEQHRIGGSIWSVPLQQCSNSTSTVDLGATWINKLLQPNVWHLVQRLGLETVRQAAAGHMIVQDHDGHTHRVAVVNGAWNELSCLKVAGKLLAHIGDALEQRSASLSGKPVTVAQWMVQNGLWHDAAAQSFGRRFTSALTGHSPEEVDFRIFLDCIASGRSPFVTTSLPSKSGGGAFMRLKKGTSTLIEGLATSLRPGSIQLNSVVDSIIQHTSSDTVTVTTASGDALTAGKVILAIPTSTCAQISFSPTLPPVKRLLLSQTRPSCRQIRMVLTYRAPWWKEADLTGQILFLGGPLLSTWDVSDHDKHHSLAVCLAGPEAATWAGLNRVTLENKVIEHLAATIGAVSRALAVQAQDVLEVNLASWAGDESNDGMSLVPHEPAVLQQPFRNVYFCGAEMASVGKDHMEGAVASGQATAKEIIQTSHHANL